MNKRTFFVFCVLVCVSGWVYIEKFSRLGNHVLLRIRIDIKFPFQICTPDYHHLSENGLPLCSNLREDCSKF